MQKGKVLLSASPTTTSSSASSEKADSLSFSSPSSTLPLAPLPTSCSSSSVTALVAPLLPSSQSSSLSSLHWCSVPSFWLLERLNVDDYPHHLNFLLILLLLPPSPSAVDDKRQTFCRHEVSTCLLISWLRYSPTCSSADSANWCRVVDVNTFLLRFIIIVIITKAAVHIGNRNPNSSCALQPNLKGECDLVPNLLSKETKKNVRSRWLLSSSNDDQDDSDADATVRWNPCHFRPWKEGALSPSLLDFGGGSEAHTSSKSSFSSTFHLDVVDANECCHCCWKVQFLNHFTTTHPIATAAHCYCCSECCNKDRPHLVKNVSTTSVANSNSVHGQTLSCLAIFNRRRFDPLSNKHSYCLIVISLSSSTLEVTNDSILLNIFIGRSSSSISSSLFLFPFWILVPVSSIHYDLVTTASFGKRWFCFNVTNIGYCGFSNFSQTFGISSIKNTFLETLTLSLKYFYDSLTIQSGNLKKDYYIDIGYQSSESLVKYLVWCVQS
ncbi:unnamed protein product [Orchesella dallaii]|uniref:Uncharacterized protein n=1 Tax=Orchesella dallaii TaxID=48710 RepID=A0ABP1RT17_9HEXA